VAVPRIFTTFTAVAFLAWASPALAQDPLTDGYAGPGGQEQTQITGTDTSTTTSPGTPITGSSTSQGSSTPQSRVAGAIVGSTQGGATSKRSLVAGGGHGVLGATAHGNNAPSSASSTAPTAAASPRSAGGGLPFTGLDVRIVLLGGLLLAGIGIATRRLASHLS